MDKYLSEYHELLRIIVYFKTWCVVCIISRKCVISTKKCCFVGIIRFSTSTAFLLSSPATGRRTDGGRADPDGVRGHGGADGGQAAAGPVEAVASPRARGGHAELRAKEDLTLG